MIPLILITFAASLIVAFAVKSFLRLTVILNLIITFAMSQLLRWFIVQQLQFLCYLFGWFLLHLRG